MFALQIMARTYDVALCIAQDADVFPDLATHVRRAAIGKRLLIVDRKGLAPINHLVKDWTAGTITYVGTGTYFSPSFSGSDPVWPKYESHATVGG